MALVFRSNSLFWRVTAKVERAVVDWGQTMNHRGECAEAHGYPYLVSSWSPFKSLKKIYIYVFQSLIQSLNRIQ